MFDYRFTVVASLTHRDPLAYSMAPRTIPTFVGQFTSRPRSIQNGTTPYGGDLGVIEGAAHSGNQALRKE